MIGRDETRFLVATIRCDRIIIIIAIVNSSVAQVLVIVVYDRVGYLRRIELMVRVG